MGCIDHTRRAGCTRTEYLCVHTVRADAPGSQAGGQVLQERGRATQIEVRFARHAELLEHRPTEVSRNVEVQIWPILGSGPPLEHVPAPSRHPLSPPA